MKKILTNFTLSEMKKNLIPHDKTNSPNAKRSACLILEPKDHMWIHGTPESVRATVLKTGSGWKDSID